MFKNAYSGIRKIYISEVMMLIASIITIVSAVLTLITVGPSTEKDIKLIILGIFVFAYAIVALVAFILNIVGLAKARLDERSFNTAFILTFVGIAVSIVSGVFAQDTVLANSFNTAVELIWLLVTCFIIIGIVNLANKLSNSAVANKGNNLLRLILCVQILAIIIRILSIIFTALNISMVLPAIFAIIAGVLTIVYHFIYISLLSKAKTMLEQE